MDLAFWFMYPRNSKPQPNIQTQLQSSLSWLTYLCKADCLIDAELGHNILIPMPCLLTQVKKFLTSAQNTEIHSASPTLSSHTITKLPDTRTPKLLNRNLKTKTCKEATKTQQQHMS
ncbi:hypothetical protein M758_2G203200 [Ceratodon purpureus]|nr:hypothetical protein M758_2G203200 [Ceratodon purpureus]